MGFTGRLYALLLTAHTVIINGSIWSTVAAVYFKVFTIFCFVS